ncbi:MAG: tRNA (N6-threonylcarbamoyladenosine(37)-N6)-methyltransferase TrmO [Syntrophomonadaceae bacterium]|nr:tRNA (N6-threonylcarbamoyladenosine(37)-N6)-methyltransferase TrmO [Syntrophomonadaceae bacterium]
MSDSVNLKPIGIVHNTFIDPDKVKIFVENSTIEVFPEYTDAMERMTEHSHIWVLGWFHKADRNVLKVTPRINKSLPEYGTFGLRAFSRPNPIGLTVVKLIEVHDNIITVSGLDFIDGTPVLDIKPYYENDIVFSPLTPYIRPTETKMIENIMMVQARNHHREECNDMLLAVKMAVLAEKELGKLSAEDIKITVRGSSCLGDTMQGITKARIAKPCRFFFEEKADQAVTIWQRGNQVITIRLKDNASIQNIKQLAGEEILDIDIVNREKE